jgi:RimJ/RimL family protein N-acetyltransferase
VFSAQVGDRPLRAHDSTVKHDFAALEPIARDLGYDEIGLHVFGDNEVARHLYRSSGYVETDVMMRKTLG